MADPYAIKKTETTPSAGPTAFWPLALVALSLATILFWQLRIAYQVRDRETLLRDQQVKVVDQSRRVQGQLQKFAKDLIDVSKTDAEAKAIVDKYGISVNSTAAAAGTAPAPQATP